MSFIGDIRGFDVSAITANPNETGAFYADVAALNADTDFNTAATNLNKIVGVTSPLSLHWLQASGTFKKIALSGEESALSLTDTPSSFTTPGAVWQVNAGLTALEEGQALRVTDNVAFNQVTLGNTGLVIGTSTPFLDSSGTLTLQNIDALDATTEATIEDAIDTLANLTTVGALDSGSITSNFGSIDIGSSALDTTGLATLGSMEVSGDSRVLGTTIVDGGFQTCPNIITSSTYSILKDDHILAVDPTLNDVLLTLPSITAGTFDDGRVFRIDRFESIANRVTIESQGGSTINDESTDIEIGLKNNSIALVALSGNWITYTRNTAAFGAIEQQTPGTTQGLTLTLTKLAVFDTDLFDTPGILSADHTSDIITVVSSENVSNGGDAFIIDFIIEISNYSNNQEIFAEVFVDGVSTGIEGVSNVSNAFNTILQARGLVQIQASKDIELRVAASNVSTATFETCELLVERAGK